MSDEQKMPDVIYAYRSDLGSIYYGQKDEWGKATPYLRCDIDPDDAVVVSKGTIETLGVILEKKDATIATLTAERDALVEAASQLRQAQRDYMAAGDLAAKGKIIGEKAKALDATLAQLKEQPND